MLLIDDNGRPDLARFDFEIERLERLLTDVKVIRASQGPKRADLADAPLLTDFRRATIALPCLVGAVCDHPRLPGDLRPIHTSELWVFAPSQGWARTMSRFYRLGRPGR